MSNELNSPRRAVRFGSFEADFRTGELRKSGLKVRLQEQPFRILALLLERPGEVVSRDELREKLWPADTFVDFEQSLNTAVNRLRTALGDTADHPRYIETLPRRGYRFVGTVEGAGSRTGPLPRPDGSRHRVPLAAFVAVTLMLFVVVAYITVQGIRKREPVHEAPLRTFTLGTTDTPRAPVISPDGQHVAYCTGSGGSHTLWIHDLDRDESRAITEPGYSMTPFWSPDSESLGFFSLTDLMKVSVHGGPVTKISQDVPPPNRAGAWSPDGKSIVFAGPMLFEVPSHGGSPMPLLEEEHHCGHPCFLPGNRGLVMTVGLPGQTKIVALDLDTERRETIVSGARPAWSPTGHVLYESSGDLWAMPFSPETLKATGEPFPVIERAGYPSVARDGTLVYLVAGKGMQQLVWRDRRGRELGPIGQSQARIMAPVLSPDGSRVAVRASEDDQGDIWIHDVERNLKRRLTTHPSSEDRPAWNPEGDRITFTSFRAGTAQLMVKAADGSGEAEPLTTVPLFAGGFGWSPDGEYFVYEASPGDVWYLHRNEDGNGYASVPFVTNAFDTRAPQLSPDARYLAYESDESGRDEVYVQPFPEGGKIVQVSTNGGEQPRWRGDGKELFYVEGRNTLVAVSVTSAPTFSVGPAKRLFNDEDAFRGRAQQYDVTADGQRFVLVKTLKEAKPVIRVVQNWYAEFRDR